MCVYPKRRNIPSLILFSNNYLWTYCFLIIKIRGMAGVDVIIHKSWEIENVESLIKPQWGVVVLKRTTERKSNKKKKAKAKKEEWNVTTGNHAFNAFSSLLFHPLIPPLFSFFFFHLLKKKKKDKNPKEWLIMLRRGVTDCWRDNKNNFSTNFSHIIFLFLSKAGHNKGRKGHKSNSSSKRIF